MTGERVDLGSERYDALYTMDRALCVGEAERLDRLTPNADGAQ
jgi:hypothetical protein